MRAGCIRGDSSVGGIIRGSDIDERSAPSQCADLDIVRTTKPHVECAERRQTNEHAVILLYEQNVISSTQKMRCLVSVRFCARIFRFRQISRISVVAMTGAAIAIDDAAASDTLLSVKQRVYAVNHKLPMRRQRLVYRPGPHGLEALADDGDAGRRGRGRRWLGRARFAAGGLGGR